MMDRICLNLTLPLLLGAVQGETQSAWKVVEFQEGRFSISLPEGYTQKKQKVTRAGEPLEVTMVIGEGANDTLFVVSYCDYFDADVKKSHVQKRLDYARDGAVSNSGGTLKSESKCEVNGHPGRDIVIAKDGQVIVRTRIYLVKNRLYQVISLGNVPANESEAFLDSFRLLK